MSQTRFSFVSLAAIVLASACASAPVVTEQPTSTPAAPTGTPGATASPTPSARPTSEPTAPPTACTVRGNNDGTQAVMLNVGGADRTYRIQFPAGFDSSLRAPVILNLHGAGEDAVVQSARSALGPDATARGYIVVHPDAMARFWKFEDDSDLDFLNALIDGLVADGCADSSRIFASGFSQGGDLASFFACHVPGRLAGVAAVGVVNAHDGCEGYVPTPFIAFAGETDPVYIPDVGLSPTVPFDGEESARPGPLVDEVAACALANGCDATPVETTEPGGATIWEYDCPPGAQIKVVLHGGGHTWPGTPVTTPPFLGQAVPDLDANALILDFFASDAV